MKHFLLGMAGIWLAAASTAAAEQGEEPTLADLEAKLQARFSEMDADADGLVTEAELQAADLKPGEIFGRKHRLRRALRRPGGEAGQAERREALFSRLDADADGSISREEFDSAAARRREGRGARRKDAADGASRVEAAKARFFSRLDQNEDGVLTATEFNAPVDRLREFDANGDGVLDREERKAARRRQGEAG